MAIEGEGAIRLWNVETGGDIDVFRVGGAMPASVSFSPNGRRALVGCVDGALFLWDLEQRELIQEFDGHENPIIEVGFSPDGTRAISADSNDWCVVWRLPDSPEVDPVEKIVPTIPWQVFDKSRLGLSLFSYDADPSSPAEESISALSGPEQKAMEFVDAIQRRAVPRLTSLVHPATKQEELKVIVAGRLTKRQLDDGQRAFEEVRLIRADPIEERVRSGQQPVRVVLANAEGFELFIDLIKQ